MKFDLFLNNTQFIESITDLRLTTQPNDGDVIILLGYYEKGDKNMVSYKWDAISVMDDNGGNIIKITSITTGRWIATFSEANVKDFGAKGDYNYDLGIGTDDYQAFQNAIDSQPNRSSNVIIPYGNYKISQTLELGQSTSIVGVQTLFPQQNTSLGILNYNSQTALHFTNNTNGFTTITASSVDYRSQGIQIKNIGIFGGGISEGKIGIELVSNTNSTALFTKIGLPTIEHVYLYSWDICLNSSGTDSANIFKSHFSGCRLGLIDGISETTISNNVFWDISETGLVINGLSASVSQNEFEPSTITGNSIYITGNAEYPKIENNHFKKNFTAITINATAPRLNALISGNTFVEANGNKYIILENANNINIINNTFASTDYNDSDGYFIYANNTINTTIKDNLFSKDTNGLITKPVSINNSFTFQVANNTHSGFITSEKIIEVVNSTERDFTVESGISKGWSFDGDVDVNKPSTYWNPGKGFIGLKGYGQISSESAFGMFLTSNGYRNNNGTWTSYAINGNSGASQVRVYPNGTIEFATNSSKTNGTSFLPTTRITIDDSGITGNGSNLTNVDAETLEGVSKTDLAQLDHVNTWTKQQKTKRTLFSGLSTISIDLDSNPKPSISLNQNATVNNPTNIKEGVTFVVAITQDGIGSRLITWGSKFKWGDDGEPTLSTLGNKTDILTFESDGVNLYLTNIKKGFYNYYTNWY
jgi:hypothetical protein